MALLALICAALTLTLKRHVRLYILAFLAIPQFYLPGLPIAVAQAYALFLLAMSFRDSELRIRNRAITVPVAVLAALTALAVILPPHPGGATLNLVYYATWASLLRYVWAERDNPRHLNIAIACTLPWILLEAALTVTFRLRPALEEAFLHSRAAEVLIGPAAPALFDGARNNVLDTAKAGGLFVNGNVASMFLGVASLLVAILARRTGSKLLGLVSVTVLGSVIATGSKTGIVLAILLPILAWTLIRVARAGRRIFILPAVLVVASVSIAAPTVITALFPTFAANGDISLGTRGGLWSLAGQLFLEHPFAGVGWDEFRTYALRYTGTAYPPHNLIIAAWADLGILGALAVVGFMAGRLVDGLAAAFQAQDMYQRQITVYALCGIIWVLAHGMADNTTIYGEVKTMILMSLLLASATRQRLDHRSALASTSVALRPLSLRDQER